jgi:NCS1 family nucleobase:cation symporter-1
LALAVGVGVALVGLLIPMVRWLYDYAWFVGFLISGSLYYLFMQSVRQPAKA